MADTEESPAQRQARIRREKREAKIKAGGSERLDKITALSGRTPESIRHESPNISSPSPTPARSAAPASLPQGQSHDRTTSDPPEVDLRSLLAQAAADQQNPEDAQDPMIRLMESIMGPMSQVGGDPNAPDANIPLQLDPNAIANATGIPSFLVSQFIGGGKKTAQTPAQAQQAFRWKIVHVVFSFFLGFYVLLSITKAIDLFGGGAVVGLTDQSLPAPATVRNPWWIFLAGEGMLQTARRMGGETVPGGYGGFRDIVQVLKEIARDGSIVVFVMGVASLFGLLEV